MIVATFSADEMDRLSARRRRRTSSPSKYRPGVAHLIDARFGRDRLCGPSRVARQPKNATATNGRTARSPTAFIGHNCRSDSFLRRQSVVVQSARAVLNVSKKRPLSPMLKAIFFATAERARYLINLSDWHKLTYILALRRPHVVEADFGLHRGQLT